MGSRDRDGNRVQRAERESVVMGKKQNRVQRAERESVVMGKKQNRVQRAERESVVMGKKQNRVQRAERECRHGQEAEPGSACRERECRHGQEAEQVLDSCMFTIFTGTLLWTIRRHLIFSCHPVLGKSAQFVPTPFLQYSKSAIHRNRAS